MNITGTARHAGVTVEVAPGGALRTLELTADALRTGGPRLADTILHAVREAAAEANERARRALETELGDLGGTELSSLGLGSEKDLADRAEDTTPDTWRV
ncbi:MULTISPECIES: YbaB/EbfC family nucleoid-associated protein [Amycolatopsis]|uniref:YbaB/EbfC family nucleoid-associated protein n=1 Tax=Amycolatopsis dendrobii TaxID=2760662 RepID=A0A7W3W5Q3_9PSEU|nr:MULTISPECIES: YbaB/EbfC family nucleoid-associated protein [Amycolatopsis]MBB1159338.1 YbaB/EbfC family nucleoid-associated protein [Amycolatopsis dendrobii]UKD56008.1 YbaB/EbfC family nucleoid-associated protein [Amycolatopsis sp. FU40]